MRKDFMKYAIVGLGGYLIGFYEMKYKMLKIMLQSKIEIEQEQEQEEKTNKEES